MVSPLNSRWPEGLQEGLAVCILIISAIFLVLHGFRLNTNRLQLKHGDRNRESPEFMMSYERDVILLNIFTLCLGILFTFAQYEAYLQQLKASDVDSDHYRYRRILSWTSQLTSLAFSLGGFIPIFLFESCVNKNVDGGDLCFFAPNPGNGYSDFVVFFVFCVSTIFLAAYVFLFTMQFMDSKSTGRYKLNGKRLILNSVSLLATVISTLLFAVMIVGDEDQNVRNWLNLSLATIIINILCVNFSWDLSYLFTFQFKRRHQSRANSYSVNKNSSTTDFRPSQHRIDFEASLSTGGVGNSRRMSLVKLAKQSIESMRQRESMKITTDPELSAKMHEPEISVNRESISVNRESISRGSRIREISQLQDHFQKMINVRTEMDASNKDDKNHGPQLDLNRNENKHNDVYNDNSTKFSVEEKYKTI